MIGQMAIAMALPWFNDLGYSVTPIFLSRSYRFYLQSSPHCPKWTKNQHGKLERMSRLLSTWHWILSWACHLIWQRIFHFKYLIAIFLSLQTPWPYSLMKPDFFRFRGILIGCSSRHVLSKTKSVTVLHNTLHYVRLSL